MPPVQEKNIAKQEGKGPQQALVIADSFDEFFRPITLETPRALLPVVGVPLINYTIEFLANAGIEEIWILCHSHAPALTRYINENLAGHYGCTVKDLPDSSSKSLGEALRDVADANIFHRPFVLVHGDIISNQKLAPIIQAHKDRAAADRNCVLTLVMTPVVEDADIKKASIAGLSTVHTNLHSVSPAQPLLMSKSVNSTFEPSPTSSALVKNEPSPIDSLPPSLASSSSGSTSKDQDKVAGTPYTSTLSAAESKVVVMDDVTGQLFSYEDHTIMHRTATTDIDIKLIQKHNIVVRDDLQYSGVAICSPEILLNFKDHFDYKNISQFARGVINDDVQDLKVFVSIVDKESYTCRVSCFRRYQQVTLDVMNRWVHPLTPDAEFARHLSWTYTRGGIYRESNTVIHRRSTLKKSAVGKLTEIEGNTTISCSTIGRNCKIGARVKIKNSFIWDNVIIEDDCVLDRAIICSGAIIRAGSTLSPGCIIGWNVRLGPKTILPPLTKLSAFNLPPPAGGNAINFATESSAVVEEEDDFDRDFDASDASSLDSNKSSSNDDPLSKLSPYNLGEGGYGRIWNVSPIGFHELYTGWENAGHVRDLIVSHISATTASEEAEKQAPRNEKEQFESEVEAIVRAHAAHEKLNVEECVLEINGRKMAHNVEYQECAKPVLLTLLKLADRKKLLASFGSLMKKFVTVFRKYLFNQDDYVELLFELESYCETDDDWIKEVQNLLFILFNNGNGIISEAGFLAWAQDHDDAAANFGLDPNDEDSDERSEFYEKAKPFIEWLKEEDEGEYDEQ